MVLGPEPLGNPPCWRDRASLEHADRLESPATAYHRVGRSAGSLGRDSSGIGVAMAGGLIVILALIAMAIFAPLIVKLLGQSPNEFNQDG